MKQIRHEQKITKDRNLRWTQKFASAKIEDLLLLAQDFQTLLYQLEVIIKVATKHIPTFAEEVEAQKQHDKQRVEVYKQLKADTTMSLEEKKAKAAEWDISPALLGITEESTNQEKGDV